MNKKTEFSNVNEDLCTSKELSRKDFIEKALDYNDEIPTQNKSKKNEGSDEDKKTFEEEVGEDEKINADELHQKSKGNSDMGESDNPKSPN